MSRLVLLVVGAAWLAVLLPPLFRSRVAPGPMGSMSSFRHQLRSLQRGPMPMRQRMPMHSMARPLAPSGPSRRAGAPRRAPAPPRRPEFDDPRYAGGRDRMAEVDAPFGDPRPRREHRDPWDGDPRDHAGHGPRERRSHRSSAGSRDDRRSHYASGSSFLSPQEMVRRRRVNVLYSLVGVNALSLFLAFSTGSSMMTLIFALALLGLIGYCYLLVQIRNQAELRRYHDYYRAA